MKKLFACALIFVMCMAGFAACGNDAAADPTPTTAPTTAPTEAPSVDTVSDLVNAKNYLFTMYKDQTEATPVDYTVVGVVNIGGTLFPIEWTADNASVKIVPGDNKMVTIDVDDQNPEEVTYTLTATLKDDAGNTETCSFTRRVPAAIIIDEGMSYADIVDAAYTLEDGLAMDGTFTLYGTVTSIDTAWSEDYQNITVTIAVAGKEDMPIQCYRLKGEGAKDLAVGDAITVEGTLKNYKGLIEFDAGCTLIGYGEHKDYTALLDAAYALEDGLAMTEPCTMSGVIHNIDTVWSEDYQNITVSMTVNGNTEKPIMCYRLKGDGAKELAVGDYITVTGTIKNYKGTIEFDAGCTLDNVVKAAGSETQEPVEEIPAVDPTGMSAAEILDAAYALESGAAFGAPCTLTGVITSIDTAYSEQYGNITVTIVVDGNTEKPVQCFRLVGDGIADLAVGDTITVTGTIKNYNGTIEFDAKCNMDAVVKGGSGETPVETPAPTEAPVAVDPTGMSAAEILDAAYALESGAAFGAPCTLTGVITSVDTAYSEQYGNITVTIVVDGNEEKKIQCFRLVGDGIADLAVGDTITVTGTIKNYNGTIEFDAKCTLDAVVKAEAPAETPAPTEAPVAVDPTGMSAAEILDAAYALESGAAFGAPCTLTGVITSVDTAYSEQYGNITVTMVVDGKEDKKIQCFRLVGDGIADLAVGDTITVTGTIKNYNGTIEFDAKCNMDAVVKATPAETPAPTEAPATDWASQYTGDYTAYTVAASEFANCGAGAKVTFDFARIADGSYSYWNFTVINYVDGWPKFTAAEDYIGEVPPFSQWEFIDVNDTSVTSYSFTLSADAVAEIVAGNGGMGIQVYGIVPYNIKVTPVEGGSSATTETPAATVDWVSQYTGDYTAYKVDVAKFADCAKGAVVTFDVARIEDADHAWWNFAVINYVDGWPKFTEAKYYADNALTFNDWGFVDANDKSVTNFKFTLSADAVAEIVAGNGGMAIQVFGIVPYNITVTPVE